jgi:two-component system response regulator CpxR
VEKNPMPVVAIFSGVFSAAEAVVQEVARRLDFPVVAEEMLEQTAKEYGISVAHLARVLVGNPSFWDHLTHAEDKILIYTRLALARVLQQDDLVYHGPGIHLIPREIRHVLRVCLVADRDFRVEQAVQQQGLSPRKARKLIDQSDAGLTHWTQKLLNQGPWQASLYDIKLPLHTTPVSEAVELICENARADALKPTRASLEAAVDFLLAARVNVKLLENGHHYCDVTASDGEVTLTINKSILRVDPLAHELQQLVQQLEGVKAVHTQVGPQYNQPDIYRRCDFQMSPKALLVDDEQEFVMTLSERLRMRDFDSEVVYDGAQALEYLQRQALDVMVLDLRMPKMSGIEVLRRVKREHPRVEVIILTGYGSEQDREEALASGAFAYLQKPVDIERLAETMQEASQRAREPAKAAGTLVDGDGEKGDARERDDQG